MIPPVRNYILALVVCGFAVNLPPVFADPVAVDSKTVVTAPNWVEGSNWYYSDGYALKVTSATPGSTVFDRLDAPGQWFSRQGFLRKDLTSATATRTSVFRTIPDQAGMSLRAGSPLTFQREYLENGVLMVHASSWSVEGRETVTVPAGTFDCWIIVWRSRSLRSDWTGFERWWYSPQAQNYVRMEYKYGTEAEGSRVLMRYQIGAQAASLAPVPGADPKIARIEPTALAPAQRVTEPAAPQTPETATIAPSRPSPEPSPEPSHEVAAPPSEKEASAKPVAHDLQPALGKTKRADTAGPATAPGHNVWHAQVASSKEEAAVRKSFDKIRDSHAELLKDLPSGITAARVGDRGIFYRAWLGQFDRSADAIALCDALRTGGTACSVSKSARDRDQRLAATL